jgi:phage terminase large subunit-like protein
LSWFTPRTVVNWHGAGFSFVLDMDLKIQTSRRADGCQQRGSRPEVDELHAHPTRSLYDNLETATGKRDQDLFWLITTAGSNREGIC